ncbi:MAG: Xaa-Pro peptidase family protein [Clostridia bacterium]
MKDTKKLFELCNGVDAILVTSPKNRFYFTGFSSTAGFLLLTKEHAVFITDFRYAEMAAPLGQQGIELIINSGKAIYETLRNKLKQGDIKVLGFEDTEMTVAEFRMYQEEFKGIELKAIGDEINLVKQIKTEEELGYIMKAQAVTDKVFKHMVSFIKPEMTEIDLAVELECQIRKNGGDGLAFDTIIASGENSSKPHAHPTAKKIKVGDPITMDFGARYNGYCSDMTRTIFVGKISPQMKNIYNIVLKAQLNAIAGMKPGLTGKQMDSMAREIIVANGFGDNYQHGTGHSLGLDIHEAPYMNTICETVFEPNMMVTIEPGIYVSGLGGVRIEDMAIFTQDGIKNLTNSSKEIIII